EKRRAPREGLRDERGFVGRWQPGIGVEHLQAKSRRRVHGAVSRIVLEEQGVRAARHIESVLMEVWEELDQPRWVGQQGDEERWRRYGAARRLPVGRTGQSPGSCG